MADDLQELFDLDVHDLIAVDSGPEEAAISAVCTITGSCTRPYCI
ncbi:hypothetical protein [Kitasatospora sp. NPDC004531]